MIKFKHSQCTFLVSFPYLPQPSLTCSKLTIEPAELFASYEQISHIVLVFLLLILNSYMPIEEILFVHNRYLMITLNSIIQQNYQHGATLGCYIASLASLLHQRNRSTRTHLLKWTQKLQKKENQKMETKVHLKRRPRIHTWQIVFFFCFCYCCGVFQHDK